MQTSVIFAFHFLMITIAISSSSQLSPTQNDCMYPYTERCRENGPDIRFPFWIKGRQPEHCGYPGLAVSCTATNETVLELPFSGSFFVRNIDYSSHTVGLYDPDGCLPQRLFHLNLSATPFLQGDESTYEQSLTFFNCSTTKPERDLISCLSIPGHQIYVSSSDQLLSSMSFSFCKKVKTLSCPLPPIDRDRGVFMELSDPEFYLILSWSQSICGSCEAYGKYCRLKNSTNSTGPETECFGLLGSPSHAALGIIVGFFVLVMSFKFYLDYRDYKSDKKDQENQERILKFLDDYKSLKPSSTTGDGKDFINEVGTIGMIHHINVVRLVGFCADGYRRALVYEFLSNESLEKFIFSRDTKRPLLSLEKLQDIAISIAKGIEYLHQGCDQRILHFDIKPHNILLDDNFNPKISDFGLAKLCSKDESAISMTTTRGTLGYIAPEVFSRNFGHVSHKSDVYSFGIMLLEMVGGRKNIDDTVENTSQVYFSQWIYNHLIGQGKELEIRIDEDGDAGIARKLTIIALWCIQWYPVDRPSMKVVVQMLEGDRESLIMPPNPFDSTIPSSNN
ncbi:hypothetical protein NE237_018299 [Protea cynaroides]|uniref:Protein kinase domain-containing protein n=1 Tax=Protea cynaroides TaxID=273540 RepID=A0A9Q0QNV3_9MAGN|nr:hypothetical protein NE237_018299 [Protea cynaroides]